MCIYIYMARCVLPPTRFAIPPDRRTQKQEQENNKTQEATRRHPAGTSVRLVESETQ